MKNDLISRQVAIDELMNSELGSWNNDDYERGTRTQHLDDVAAIKRVPSAQPEPKWIPVEDELPKEGERVLVTDIDGTIEIANYIEYASDDGGIEWWAHDYQCYPIAWRELPKPYERSEE